DVVATLLARDSAKRGVTDVVVRHAGFVLPVAQSPAGTTTAFGRFVVPTAQPATSRRTAKARAVAVPASIDRLFQRRIPPDRVPPADAAVRLPWSSSREMSSRTPTFTASAVPVLAIVTV